MGKQTSSARAAALQVALATRAEWTRAQDFHPSVESYGVVATNFTFGDQYGTRFSYRAARRAALEIARSARADARTARAAQLPLEHWHLTVTTGIIAQYSTAYPDVRSAAKAAFAVCRDLRSRGFVVSPATEERQPGQGGQVWYDRNGRQTIVNVHSCSSGHCQTERHTTAVLS